MSTANFAYLALVVAGFAAFIVALGYGQIRCALADRRSPAPWRSEDADSHREAA